MKAELFNYTCWVKHSDASYLKISLAQLLNTCQFEILGFMEHHFTPQGYTCIWLLGESHLAVHTYPEENKSYIELTSCVKAKNENFKQLLGSFFEIEVNLG
jgi:S-adenosylmethionine decarboxylase